MSLAMTAILRLPAVSNSSSVPHEDGVSLWGSSFPLPTTRSGGSGLFGINERRNRTMVVEAKGKKGMMGRQFQRSPPPPLPKIEDDGNPKFVIFIRSSSVYLWYPLSLITGGTTAKIMVAAKDNFLGKYLYKDTIARDLAAVIYKDEKEIQKTAFKQFRVLRTSASFRYGYKLVVNGNVRAALTPSNVIELPTEEELRTALDKVKDFFGDAASSAKESFGNITSLSSLTAEEAESNS